MVKRLKYKEFIELYSVSAHILCNWCNTNDRFVFDIFDRYTMSFDIFVFILWTAKLLQRLCRKYNFSPINSFMELWLRLLVTFNYTDFYFFSVHSSTSDFLLSFAINCLQNPLILNIKEIKADIARNSSVRYLFKCSNVKMLNQ